jgi:xylulokinase
LRELQVPGKANRQILAIDLGTSGPKVGLVGGNGEVDRFEFEPVPLILSPGGGAEQDPGDWWSAIGCASRRLLASRKLPVEAIIAVCSTAQWSGTVAVDAGGHPLMNAILWLDSRGEKHVREITGGFPRIAGFGVRKLFTWLRKSGGLPGHSGKDPTAHILFLKNEQPEIYRRTFKFLEPKDYLNLRLTGQCAASFDSIALHWVTDNRDISNVCYDTQLLALARIDREKLPDLIPATNTLGPLTSEAAAHLGVRAGIPVVMGTPDVHSSTIGSGAIRDCDCSLYLGTSAWMSCHFPKKKVDILNSIAALPSALPGKYIVLNDQECAGACLTFARDHLYPLKTEGGTEDDPWRSYERLTELASKAPAGSGEVIFTPWLNGERTPVDNPFLRGGFHNLSMRTERPHLIRAVLEGVAYNSRWLLECVEKFTGRRADPIRLAGGCARSELWCQIHADVLGREILLVRDPILANVRGAGLLAFAALGHVQWDDIPRLVPIQRRFQPDPANAAKYGQLYGAFRKIHAKTNGIYRSLNAGTQTP